MTDPPAAAAAAAGPVESPQPLPLLLLLLCWCVSGETASYSRLWRDRPSFCKQQQQQYAAAVAFSNMSPDFSSNSGSSS
jgi:hypothetical protein